MAPCAPVSCQPCRVALLLLTLVLRCLGHLRAGIALHPGPCFCSRPLSQRDAGGSSEILVSVWDRMVGLDLHHIAIRRRRLSLRRWIEHATRYFIDAREREVQVARLSEQLSSARFAALQAQLNPHFLFNTLNTITVLVRDNDRQGAVSIIEHLSELLRRTLSRHQANEVTLGEELELVRQYVAIEQARFSDRLRPEFRIPESLMSATIPSFALQHLVENAIRHGIAKDSDAGLLLVTATRLGDVLEITVINDGVSIDRSVPAPAGHGIENTRERLRALHGENASLEIVPRSEGGTIATLRVPYREMRPEPNVETR
jgi:LytS/YehU family sensor histidine kinase